MGEVGPFAPLFERDKAKIKKKVNSHMIVK